MVGLDSAHGDQRIGTRVQCLGHYVFQFANLVATRCQTCQVITFEKQFFDTNMIREAIGLHDRRRQPCQM